MLSKKESLSQTDSGKHQVNPVKDLFSTNVKHVGPNTAKPYERMRNSCTSYTNSLHEALLAKDGLTFWKCWQSKFEGRPITAHKLMVVLNLKL